MTEEWRPVVGYEELYEVSSLGRVRKSDGKVLTATVGSAGRPAVTLFGPTRRTVRVSVLVCTAWHGPKPFPKAFVLHGNDHPADNRPENLRWGTRSENVLDSIKNGTHALTKRKNCPRGHILAEPNLRPDQMRKGKRTCLACMRARSYHLLHPDQDLDQLMDQYYAAVRPADHPGQEQGR